MKTSKINFGRCVRVLLILLIGLSAACGDESSDGEIVGNESSMSADTVSNGPEVPPEDTCGQEYSVCGYIRIPADFTGTPTSLAVALYREPTPTGAPDVVLTQIPSPSVTPGELYPIRVFPFLDTGDFHLWVFIYVEGGGTNRPINGVDYMGNPGSPITFDGQALEFDTVVVEPASGW